MAELNLRLDIRVTPALVRWGLAGLLLSVFAPELATESVTLTTYYPAPSGIYTQLIATNNTYLSRDGGNLGIGTTSLHSSGGFTAKTTLDAGGSMLGLAVRGSASPAIKIINSSNTELGTVAGVTAAGAWATGSTVNDIVMRSPAGRLILATGASNTPRLVMDGSGYVGIGGAPTASASNLPLQTSGLRATQTGCTITGFTTGTTNCGANNYATLIAGVWAEYMVTGNIATTGGGGGQEGSMLCCPCGGACP
ncbi:MAG: hypothetical protein HY921_02490 [Elusimicrobia bacterium]|nr:hypothetical protein [Elusimicrobiota bacterium]